MPKKLKIAITGGIGSGKSTVSGVIESHGFTVIKADLISKEILSSSQPIREQIKKMFGDQSFVDGKPNKEYLAEKVFTNASNLKKINQILHPPTIRQIEKLMEEELQSSDLVFVEAALIYEAEMDNLFDHVLVVTSPDKDRINRIIQRDEVSEAKVRDRMKNQFSQEKKKKLADFVLSNDKSLIELKIRAEFFLKVFQNLVK